MANKGFCAVILLCCFLTWLNLEAAGLELSCETMNHLYDLWSDSWFGEDPTREKSAWMIRNPEGKFEWKRWPATRKWKKEIWKGAIPANIVAQVHTHPVNTDPRPSTKDRIFSKTANVLLYTVSRKGIWKVTPTGKMTQEAGANWHIDVYKTRCKRDF